MLRYVTTVVPVNFLNPQVKVLFCSTFRDFRKSTDVGSYDTFPICPAGKKEKCVDEEYGAFVKIYWQMKTTVLGRKAVPLSLCPTQI